MMVIASRAPGPRLRRTMSAGRLGGGEAQSAEVSAETSEATQVAVTGVWRTRVEPEPETWTSSEGGWGEGRAPQSGQSEGTPVPHLPVRNLTRRELLVYSP